MQISFAKIKKPVTFVKSNANDMTALRSMLDQNHIPMRVLDVTPRMRDGYISRMANRLLWVERLRESALINKDHHKVKQAEYLGNMIADRIKSMYSFKYQ